jgi:hypothetical protein
MKKQMRLIINTFNDIDVCNDNVLDDIEAKLFRNRNKQDREGKRTKHKKFIKEQQYKPILSSKSKPSHFDEND